jgi:hypothetical protein
MSPASARRRIVMAVVMARTVRGEPPAATHPLDHHPLVGRSPTTH